MSSFIRIMVKFFIFILLANVSLADTMVPMTKHEISLFREIFTKTSGKSSKHCTGEPVLSVANKKYSFTLVDYYKVSAVNMNKFCVVSSSMSDEDFESQDCISEKGFNKCELWETLEVNAEYLSDFKISNKNYLDLVLVENGDTEEYDDDEIYIGDTFSNIEDEKLTFLSKLASIPLNDIVNKKGSYFTKNEFEVEILKPHGRVREMTDEENETILEKSYNIKNPKVPLDVITYSANDIDFSKGYFYFINRPDPNFKDYVPSIMGPSWRNSSIANEPVPGDYFIRYKLDNEVDVHKYNCNGEFPYLGLTMPTNGSEKYKITIAAQWWCI